MAPEPQRRRATGAGKALAGATLLAVAAQLRPGTANMFAVLPGRLTQAQQHGAVYGRLNGRQGRQVGLRATREEILAQQAGMVRELSPITKDDLMINFFIFLAFSIPFLYAAYEFWRRIAFGQQFGTADEQVVFERFDDAEAQKQAAAEAAASPTAAEEAGVLAASAAEEGTPKKQRPIGRKDRMTIGMDADTNRNRRTLGLDALLFAYFLMFLAAATVGVSGYAVLPLLTGQIAVAE